MKALLYIAAFLGGYGIAAWNDDRVSMIDREQSAQSLCIPAFADEIASLSSVNGRFTCAIKRGHTVISRFEV